jgi:hypothetical protein
MRQALLASIVALASTACHFSPKQWTTAPPQKQASPNVFDITWQTTDPNGIPLNPLWGSQSSTTNPALPPAHQPRCEADPRQCTAQKFVEDWAPKPSVCRVGVATGLAGPIPAHFDWSLATYVGFVRPSVPTISEDEDYNFIFQAGEPNPSAGLTEANGQAPFDTSTKYIELEMFSHEVADRFALKWWTDFAREARGAKTGDADAQQRINDGWAPLNRSPRAVVIGLLGVDCEHGCKSELHPVHALAVEADPTPSHNVWQIFARNWGNGGSCSTFDHEFNAPRLGLEIPPPSIGATPEAVLKAAFARSDDSIALPVFSLPAGHEGLLVTLGLAPPAVKGFEELEVTIAWKGTTDTAPPAPPAPRSAARVSPAPAPGQIPVPSATSAETESAYILRVVHSLPDSGPDSVRSTTEKRLEDALKRPPRAQERNRVTEGVDTTIQPSPPTAGPAPPRASTPRTALRDVATDRSKRLWAILCEATQGQLPLFNGKDISSICRDVDWKKKG